MDKHHEFSKTSFSNRDLGGLFRSHEQLVNISLLLVSFFLSVLGAEIALRYLTNFPIHGESNLQQHPLLGYTLSPDLPDVDSEGFRNPPGIGTTILAIGDSHTQGWNVEYEDSWPAKLSSKIQKPVFNFGVGGYGVLHYGVILAKLVPANTTEIILALYTGNDLGPGPGCESCITTAGEKAIESVFGIEAPQCVATGHSYGHGIINSINSINSLTSYLKEKTALYSSISYFWYTYQNKILHKSITSQSGRARETRDEFITIQHVPFNAKKFERHYACTNLANKEVAARVEFFLAVIEKFRQLRPNINLKVLLIPSKELVLVSTELTCLKTERSALALSEIALRGYLQEILQSKGFQIEDALGHLVESYCNSSPRAQENFYKALDGHPHSKGYEAYAEAAYSLYRRNTDSN